jgi:hypothetical protein
MTQILPAPELAQQETRGDEVIPFDVTLALADTSETLFTVPGGKRLRSIAVVNRSSGQAVAHVALAAATPATTSDMLLGRRDSAGIEQLDLPEGTYAFIGGAGDTPRVTGVAVVGPALV